LSAAGPKTLRVLVVDGAASRRRTLARHLAALPALELVGESRNGCEALLHIRSQVPNVVLLDVRLPDMSGFDVVRELSGEALPAILFMARADTEAGRSLKSGGFECLQKPVTALVLEAAMERARRRLGSRWQNNQGKRLLKFVKRLGMDKKGPGPNRGSRMGPVLEIRDSGKIDVLRQEDIERIEAAGDYMCIHALGETYILRKTMKALERELQVECLQRIHRSTIVNMRHVTALEPHINGEFFLELKSGHKVKLSRTYRHKLNFLELD